MNGAGGFLVFLSIVVLCYLAIQEANQHDECKAELHKLESSR